MFIEEQVTNRLSSEGNRRSWDKQLSENEMIAQGFVFLVATYGGTALTLAFSIYEMAVNEDIQRRLYDELTEAIDSETGEIPDDEFMPDQKQLIRPYTYLPFGAGPRHCVGMRFALFEIKLALAHIVLRYRFLRCPQTDVPIRYEKFIHQTLPITALLIINQD
ncbi:unnamed protein product [Oppiella nova]|uniref:Cytochrome P450 n=1 Tax=Oppiella nova TaxID=334625 RepID=A0A7R9M9B1_9ACAR|nr:unnamed protein product [Oppiella nova]CAG2171870.1 unnamed protein product [Oppiella nova]